MLQDQVPLVNEEYSEPGLTNAPDNSYGVSRRYEPNKWTPQGWMLIYVVASVHYGDHIFAQPSVNPSTAHTLHVDKHIHQFPLIVSRERHVGVIL